MRGGLFCEIQEFGSGDEKNVDSNFEAFAFVFSAPALAASAQAPSDCHPRPRLRPTPSPLKTPVAAGPRRAPGRWAPSSTGAPESATVPISSSSRSASSSASRSLRVLHAGILSGQFELAGNIMPLWQAYTPAPHDADFQSIRVVTYTAAASAAAPSPESASPRSSFAGTSSPGRNAFSRGSRAQAGSSTPPTSFRPTCLCRTASPGGTSVWNFSPQGGIGIHWFTGRKRSIDLGVNAVHISSASLGDRNPGVNASLQVQVGYTWWK